jgi:hypothetical protein
MTLRIYVDFNTMTADARERAYINTGIQGNLAGSLRSGMVVVLADETLEVEAVIEYDEGDQTWWGEPIWSTSRDLAHPEPTVEARP